MFVGRGKVMGNLQIHVGAEIKVILSQKSGLVYRCVSRRSSCAVVLQVAARLRWRLAMRCLQSGTTAVTSISMRARSSTSAATSTQVMAGKFFPITSR